MLDVATHSVGRSVTERSGIASVSAAALERRLIWLYVLGSAAAVAVTFFLVFIGLQLNLYQWICLLGYAPICVGFYVIIDIWMIRRHYKPVGEALGKIERGERPTHEEVSRALVRALNLPFYSFLRVTFVHGPLASGALTAGLYVCNAFLDTNYANWQILVFSATVLFFASPTHAILEFFAISKDMTPPIVRLWQHCDRLLDEHRPELISIKLKGKLFYLSIFVTSLPLLFFAVSIIFKVNLLLRDLGVDATFEQLLPLLMWVVGVVVVCMAGALVMSILTASEVSRSASKLIEAMNEVESGVLDNRLFITGTDEYADLYRGYNLMTQGLREEVKILEVAHDLTGELNLDVLLERIMRAATDLLDADRGTLFVHDKKRKQLWSRFAEGLASREIRIPDHVGIAGHSFQKNEVLNVKDPYSHPLFNSTIDKQTGYKTTSILCMPIINKAGVSIGVTQVLNKHGGHFTLKDEQRLRAFTAQIAVSLENAQLFEDVLNMKNYNESILRSTSNGMVTLNKERQVVTVNDAASRILQRSETDVIGLAATALFGPANQWVLDSVERVEATGTSNLSFDQAITLENGDPVSVNMTAVPLIDANKADIGSKPYRC
jgi:adenylate cyclase